jgi:formylglycine-generating enzyme required for sulfatase activity
MQPDRPPWASATGRDRFGAWAELRLAGVAHRLRWIPSGRFVMGSPDGEPGRSSVEGPAHEVAITRGFWLGETPVTQALWQAVTGANPSRFPSPDRPVDQVSWDDCHTELLTRLNAAIPHAHDEGFRLPTEAQWEYACRAGTRAATYAGPIEIRNANDAPVLEAIAWYGGNSFIDFDLPEGFDASCWLGRPGPTLAGSHRVAHKHPNPWGLYDMLGNVYEWCLDEMRTYTSEPQDDPTGPDAPGEHRVIRGGSWHEDANYLRAACRDEDPPDQRSSNLGLRLAMARPVSS